MKEIPLTKSHRLEESVWHSNEAHKQAGPYFQLNTLTMKILMETPNHLESTGPTVFNAWVKRVEITDYLYKKILWILCRGTESWRVANKSVEDRESAISLIVAPPKKPTDIARRSTKWEIEVHHFQIKLRVTGKIIDQSSYHTWVRLSQVGPNFAKVRFFVDI